MLLSSGANPNLADSSGNTPIHDSLRDLSIYDNKITIQNVNTLVKGGADLMLRNNKGETPFHLAAESKHRGLLPIIFEAMGEEAAQRSLSMSNPSPLQYAVEWGLGRECRISDREIRYYRFQ
jgi:ankyrin repeat protein